MYKSSHAVFTRVTSICAAALLIALVASADLKSAKVAYQAGKWKCCAIPIR